MFRTRYRDDVVKSSEIVRMEHCKLQFKDTQANIKVDIDNDYSNQPYTYTPYKFSGAMPFRQCGDNGYVKPSVAQINLKDENNKIIADKDIAVCPRVQVPVYFTADRGKAPYTFEYRQVTLDADGHRIEEKSVTTVGDEKEFIIKSPENSQGNTTYVYQLLSVTDSTPYIDDNGIFHDGFTVRYDDTDGCEDLSQSVTIYVNNCTDSDGDGVFDKDDADDDNDGITDTEEQEYCDMPSVLAENSNLQGSGAYKGQLVFFDWGTQKLAQGVSSSVVVNDITYTATVIDFQFDGVSKSDGYHGADIANYPGSFIKDVYNDTGKNEIFKGNLGDIDTKDMGSVRCTFAVTATKNGQPIDALFDMLVFDGESTDKEEEMRITTYRSPLEIFHQEGTPKEGDVLGEGTRRVIIRRSGNSTKPEQTKDKAGTAIYEAKNERMITFEARSIGGGQGFGIALRLEQMMLMTLLLLLIW